MGRRMKNYRVMAEDFYSEGNLDKALTMYEKALEFSQTEDDTCLILFNIGVILTELGNPSEAMVFYNRIIGIDPDYHDAYYQKAVIMEDMGKTELAISNYRTALMLEPEDTMSMYNLANLYDLQGDVETGRSILEKILKIEPDHPYALNNLGAIYESEGRYSEAYDLLARSIESNDAFFMSHFNMGVVLNALGNKDRALVHYGIAIDLNPRYHYSYLNMSAIYIEKKQYEEAIGILTDGIVSNREAHDLYYNRACSSAILGENVKALNDIEFSLKLHPQLIEWVQRDKDFDTLRSDKRFDEIIKSHIMTYGKEEANDNDQDKR